MIIKINKRSLLKTKERSLLVYRQSVNQINTQDTPKGNNRIQFRSLFRRIQQRPTPTLLQFL
ncbi:hypothetical protein NG796_03905 [Laspinema sp. A4]|uniref:hypothetical protein n=1 Tax=Laspinema sp. D2d TaxID=2953686 RepID=UPI0021BB589C|nr:hypothetical protein [Laspinema sp. D2d]MCT7982429.1 hypothetical protein [Laspinema sp. D2d]